MTSTGQHPARDEIYRTARDKVDDFVFDHDVTRVFPDMVRRSVPGYDTIVDLIAVVVGNHLDAASTVYDLGCSRGAVVRSLLRAVGDLPFELFAVDSSAPMIEACRREIVDHRVSFHCSDMREFSIQDADAVVMNLALQFVPPADRQTLLRAISTGTRANGILVLTEKVPAAQEIEELHIQFKRFSGYSETEIEQKRAALEAVMKLDAIDQHVERLKDVGYRRVQIWYQCLNWVSFLAHK